MMFEKEVNYNVVVLVSCILLLVLIVVDGSGSLVDTCRPDIQNLGNCLMYVTGKQAEPSKECCNTVSGIKDRHPVCLCFFIAQAHNGSETIKSLGIQESKLLQLPDSCHLSNASITNCPSLLGISPKSPAAAIFMNPPSSAGASTSGTGGSKSNSESSSGIKNHPNAGFLVATIILTLSAFLTIIIPILP